jgi:hypothetical protein
MCIGKFPTDLHELRGNQSKSAAFEAGDNLPNQRALDAIWFD